MKNPPYFFYTSDADPSLIARKIDITDNVIPSANSVMAKNLFYLGKYFYKKQYIDKSEIMLLGIQNQILQSGSFFSNWYELQLHYVYPFYEVAVIGNKAENFAAELDKNYKPNTILLGGKEEGNLELLENKLIKGQTMIYVCIDKVCNLPVTSVEKAMKQMK